MGAVFMSCRACWRFQKDKEVTYRLFVYCLLILVKRQWSKRTTLIYRNDPPTLDCWLAQKTSSTNSTIVRWINHLLDNRHIVENLSISSCIVTNYRRVTMREGRVKESDSILPVRKLME